MARSIGHPSILRVAASLAHGREDGERARRRGEPITANPWRHVPAKAQMWRQGWLAEDARMRQEAPPCA